METIPSTTKRSKRDFYKEKKQEVMWITAAIILQFFSDYYLYTRRRVLTNSPSALAFFQKGKLWAGISIGWLTFFMHVNLPTGWLALFQNNHYHITLCKYSISTQTTPFHPVHMNLPEEKGSYIVDIWCAHASADVSCFGRECFFDCNCLCRRTDPT